CLNRAGKKTERAIGEIAAAWNQQMHIPNVELIYDSASQLDQIDTVKVTSAQPTYKTTDDMLVDILQREGCLLVKPKNWFAHCVMVLTPDLINNEEKTGVITDASSSPSTTVKTHYNFDELVHINLALYEEAIDIQLDNLSMIYANMDSILHSQYDIDSTLE
ncbi:unnamed protein product, partial [Adineta steineri]